MPAPCGSTTWASTPRRAARRVAARRRRVPPPPARMRSHKGSFGDVAILGGAPGNDRRRAARRARRARGRRRPVLRVPARASGWRTIRSAPSSCSAATGGRCRRPLAPDHRGLRLRRRRRCATSAAPVLAPRRASCSMPMPSTRIASDAKLQTLLRARADRAPRHRAHAAPLGSGAAARQRRGAGAGRPARRGAGAGRRLPLRRRPEGLGHRDRGAAALPSSAQRERRAGHRRHRRRAGRLAGRPVGAAAGRLRHDVAMQVACEAAYSHGARLDRCRPPVLRAADLVDALAAGRCPSVAARPRPGALADRRASAALRRAPPASAGVPPPPLRLRRALTARSASYGGQLRWPTARQRSRRAR